MLSFLPPSRRSDMPLKRHIIHRFRPALYDIMLNRYVAHIDTRRLCRFCRLQSLRGYSSHNDTIPSRYSKKKHVYGIVITKFDFSCVRSIFIRR
jgi:hypothetical protein